MISWILINEYNISPDSDETVSEKVCDFVSGIELDEYDKKILQYLQEDGSISNLELSKKIGLAPSSCLLRTKALKKNGIITGTSVKLDEKKLGFGTVAFAKVRINPLTREVSNRFMEEIKKINQVVECYTITGDAAFLIKIVAKDLAEYSNLVIDKIMSIDAVENVESSMVVETLKETVFLPLD